MTDKTKPTTRAKKPKDDVSTLAGSEGFQRVLKKFEEWLDVTIEQARQKAQPPAAQPADVPPPPA